MPSIPLAELTVEVIANNRQIIAALKEVEAAKDKALASGDKTGLQAALDRLGTSASDAERRLTPLTGTASRLVGEMNALGVAVKSGLVPLGEGVKRYRELEATLKGLQATLKGSGAGYDVLSRAVKAAGAEVKTLEGLQKQAAGAYKTDEIARYARALTDITNARKAGLASDRDASAQLKSLQSQMAQYAGSLQKGSDELTALNRVTVAAAGEARKLVAEQEKLERAFRADYLRTYAGEFRQVDAAVKSGFASYAEGSRKVEQLSADLRSQQGELGRTGKEFDQLSRLLQGAATQQERYQKAAESAARSNDAAEIRAYGAELRQLEATLTDTARQLGQLDAQQRAIRYDTAGVASYRAESERLGVSFTGVGRGLQELLGRLREQSAALQAAGRDYSGVERLIQQTEAAAQRLAGTQDRVNAAYRAADLSRFTTELRNIEQAQKSGLTTSEQAARAVGDLEAKYRGYVASLGVTSRELTTYARVQAEAGRSAADLATAQERAARAFDTAALRGFTGELTNLLRAQREGSASFADTARAVAELQGRMREYGSSVGTTAADQADLNRLLELSERALQSVGTAAERASSGFDTDRLDRFTAELERLDAAQRDLGNGLERLAQSGDRLGASFDDSRLQGFRAELERLIAAQRDGSASFDDTARSVDSLQTRLRDYAGSLDQTTAEHETLSRTLSDVDAALTDLGAAAERASQGFEGAGVEDFTAALERLDAAQKDLGNGLDTLAGSSDRLGQSFDSSRLEAFRGDLEQLIASQRDGSASFEETARAVEDVQTRLRDYASTLDATSAEHETLNRSLNDIDAALTDLGTAAERAQAGFEGTQVRDFAGELERVGGASDGLAGELGQIEGELSQLGGSFRDAGAAAGVAAGDQERYGAATRELDGSLAGIEAELSQLAGSFRESGQEASVSAGEMSRLADVQTQLQGATERLAAAQERSQNASHSEYVRQQVAALADLKLALERGDIAQEQFSESARNIGAALDTARSGLDANTRAYSGYTGALTKVESSLAQAEGRLRTFGIGAGVAAGVGDQLQNVLFALGPAGEAMGVAMLSAGAGMQGAAASAKLLNIALTVGLVGGIVALGVGAVALVKNMFALDTGLTDVAKTTGFTGEQLNGLAKELQQIALNTGTPVKELTGLAAVAGSLGIKGVADVASFTDTINKLAIATDIVGEEGATQLAKFVTVTKSAGDTVGESAALVGNVITRLGNSLSATEAPILAMSTRLAGLATTADLSQTDILALAGAYVSLGFTAESAGTPLVKLVNIISQAGKEGGPALDSLAKGAGLTREEFQRLAAEDPAAAFEAYIKGLKGASDAGVNINPIIKEVTRGSTEMFDVVSRGVGGFDVLALSMSEAANEAEKMSALQIELDNRLGSLEGITAKIGQTFAFMGDSLALRLIPYLKTGLTGVLDFSRAVIGLEQTGSGAATFATNAGIAFNQFAVGMNDSTRAAQTLAGQLGGMFGVLGEGLDTAQNATNNAALATNTFLRQLVGLPPITNQAAVGLGSAAGAADDFSNAGVFLASQVPEISTALQRLGGISDMSRAEMVAYRDELVALTAKYPEAEYAIEGAIAILNDQIGTLQETDEATAAHVTSLDSLRKKREELIAQYNAAPIGSAAQAEALAAIQAVDAQIAANDALSASAQETADDTVGAVDLSVKAYATVADAVSVLPTAYATVAGAIDVSNRAWASVAAPVSTAVTAYASVKDAVNVMVQAYATVPAEVAIPIPDAKPIVDFAAVVRVQLADAFAEADRQALAFGNSNLAVAGRVEALKAAIQTLLSQGFDPSGAAVQNLVSQLDALTAAQERAEQAAQRYADNLEATRSAQEALGDASGIATGDIDGLIGSLDAAAQGTGTLGEQARQAQADLQALELARGLAETFNVFGDAARTALSDIPNLSQEAKSGLEAIAEGMDSASTALQDGKVTGGEALSAIGEIAQDVGRSLGVEVGSGADIALGALGGFAEAGGKLLAGDVVGAVTTAVSTALEAIIGFFTQAQREAEELAKQIDEAFASIDQSQDNIREAKLDQIEQTNELLYAQGQIDELTYIVVQTQIDLVRLYDEHQAAMIDLENRRQEALAGVTDPATIAQINAQFNSEAATLQSGFELNQATIIQGGVDEAKAAGYATDTFLSALDERNLLLNNEIIGSVSQFVGSLNIYDSYALGALSASGENVAAGAEAGAQRGAQGIDAGTQLTTQAVTDGAAQMTAAAALLGAAGPAITSAFGLLSGAFGAGGSSTALAAQGSSTLVRTATEGVSQTDYAGLIGGSAPLIQSAFGLLSGAFTAGGSSAALGALGAAGALEGAVRPFGDTAYADLVAGAAPGVTSAFGLLGGSFVSGGALAAAGATGAGTTLQAATGTLKDIDYVGLVSGALPAINTAFSNLSGAFVQGGQLSAQGVSQAQQQQADAQAQYQASLQTSVGGLTSGVVPQVASQHAAIATAFVQGGQASAGGMQSAQTQQVSQVQGYQGQLIGAVGGIGGGVSPAVASAHAAIASAFAQAGGSTAQSISGALGQITAGVGTYSSLSGAVSSVFGGVSSTVVSQGSALGGAFTQVGGSAVGAINTAFSQMQGSLGAQGSGLQNTAASVFGGVAGTVTSQGSGVAGSFQSTGSQIQGSIVSGIGGSAQVMQSQGSSFSGTVSSVWNALSGAQNSGAGGFTGTINSTFGSVRAAIGAGVSSAAQTMQSGGSSFSSTVSSAWSALSGAQNSGANQFGGVLNSSFAAVRGDIQSGYSLTTQGYQQGSSQNQAAIQAAYNAEEARFRSESAAMQSAIANAKGSEKARLIAEYNTMKAEHAARSNAYQSAIAAAGSGEKGALSSAANAVIGQLGSYGSSVSSKTASEFSGLISSYTTNSSRYKSAIEQQSSQIRGALEAAARLITSFKYPDFPKPPSPPKTALTGDAGDSLGFSAVSYTAPLIGAFAADGLPDYSAATGNVMAYAAATGSLLDLFGGSRTLTLTNVQERAMNLTVTIGGDFGRMLQGPVAGFERAANLMWEVAKFERETALINRETAELNRSGVARRGSYEDARRPPKRRS